MKRARRILDAAQVSPLIVNIVLPGDELDKLVIEPNAGLGVKGRRHLYACVCTR